MKKLLIERTAVRRILLITIGLVISTVSAVLGQRLSPSDFAYVGAFAIDADYSTDNPWNAYGQRGMTFDPSGDPGNGDELPGSLWVTGHDYERHVFELSIPTPVDGVYSFSQLPKPTLLTVPTQFTGGCGSGSAWFAGVEIQDDSIWASCAEWYNVTGEDLPAIMWRRNLSNLSNLQGPFHAGPLGAPEFHSNRQGMYLFSIPSDWSDAHLGGRTLATGMHRNSHGGTMGPTILVFDPDNPSDAYDLLWYRQRDQPGDNCFSDKSNCDFPGYAACDIWQGTAWVRTSTTDTVLIAGKKFEGASDYQPGGWVCDPGFGEILFYDPNDFAARIAGTLKPWEVVPYEQWRPSELWHEAHEIGGIAYDEAKGLFYVVETHAGPFGSAVVHVYRIKTTTSS